MKTESFILLFCLLNICFTQDSENQCESQFRSILQNKCLGLGSCTFNTANKKCLPISSCSGKSSDNCAKTIPSNYNNKKCEYDSVNSSCNEVNKVCSDYNKAVDGNAIFGDECSSLTKVNGQGDRCYYSYRNGNLGSSRTCSTHYNSCDSINNLSDKSTKCEVNIPSDLTKKCLWNSDSQQCVEANRTCTEYQYLYEWANKDNCNKLEASNGASCVYDPISGCTEAYPCSKWHNDQANCDDNKTPLNDAGDDYDYLYKCKYNTANNKCEKVRKTCAEYNNGYLLKGDADCSQFSPEDSTNKKCVYSSSSSSSESCIEQYKTCQLYDENVADKSRTECEGLILDDPNKKCVYIKEEHKCEEGNVYNNCNEYKGSDRKICERILSPKRNSYCVLDKDSVCKERDFFCVEAYDRYDCLIYAKPTDDTKKCVWDNNLCIEQYKGCEDYVEKRSNSETDCDDLEVYNGKKCYYNSDKCTSKNKICSEATSKEECKLIEKTGVSDPDRKYCEWDSTNSNCRENYKYCSDYRPTSSSGSLSSITCRNIKPYNPETNTLDLAYKCEVKETSVGCEKVPKECTEARSNKILCDLISPLIKDNRIKYCAFIQGTCVEQYKTCELVDELKSNFENLCKNNIPNSHYFPGICEYTYDNDNGKYKCKTKSTSFCNLFNTITYQDYKYLCLSINPNCSYSGGSCKNITKSCTDIKFYTQDDNNKAICEAIKLSDEDKICVLKEDKSGCEEVYRESIPFIYADNANSNSNSAFKLNANGMQIILILLSLLF